MCFSTIWGRYHYVADVFAGIATGALGYVVGGWLVRRKADERRTKWEIVSQEAQSFGD
jgi:membrane-associated phospholipid phosphatase